MSVIRDFRGESGVVYRYLHVENAGVTPLGAGNFLYVQAGGEQSVIVYAGEGERLTTAIGERWREAVERHGATHIFARRNVSLKTRQEELADLVGAHVPVMNAPGAA